MRATRIASIFFRTIFWIILAVVLLVSGVILTLYSQWGQNIIRNTLVEKLNIVPGMQVEIDGFSMKFPVDVSLTGVSMVQDGDTMVRVDTLKAGVGLLPLFAGKIDVRQAELKNGYYRLGTPDSLMYMQIQAADVLLKPASVTLSDMDIHVEDGYIHDGRVKMVLRQDTITSSTDSTAQQAMKIRIDRLQLRNLTYMMSMLPTIYNLSANIGQGAIDKGEIDMTKQTVAIHKFSADSLDAAYIAPDSATIAATPIVAPSTDSPTSPPWTVMIDTIEVRHSHALYTTQGVNPLPGLDFAYIEANDLDLQVVDFYNQATKLRLPLTMHATERCGVTLDATGIFSLDSLAMYFTDFNITTSNTYLDVSGMMGMGDLLTDASLPLLLNVKGYCGIPDLRLMFPDFGPYLKLLNRSLEVRLDLKGTAGDIDLQQAMLAVGGVANINGRGRLQNVFDPDHIGGDINLTGHILNVKSIVKSLTGPDSGILVPPMTLSGNMHMHRGIMDGMLKAATLGGHVALDAMLNTHNDGYDLDLKVDDFPLHAFLDSIPVGNLTMKMAAKGNGFDIFKPSTHTDINALVESVEYNGYDYRDIDLKMSLHDGEGEFELKSNNPDLIVSIDGSGNLTGDSYDWQVKLDGENIDLEGLHLSDTRMTINTQMTADLTYVPATKEIQAKIDLPQLDYKGDADLAFTITDVDANFLTNDSLTEIRVLNRDLHALASTPTPLDSITPRLDDIMALVTSQIDQRKIDVDTLQKILPQFSLDVTAGSDNMINDILQSKDMRIKHLFLNANNDSSMYVSSQILQLRSPSMLLDTIKLSLTQDDNRMRIVGELDNRQGNMDEWAHVTANGIINTDRLSIRMTQQNVKYETGFDLGAIAVFADSTVTARLFPLTPIIGYKKWSVNFDNFIYYNFISHHIDANLKMKGVDSSLELYTDHPLDHHYDATDSINAVTLNISDIRLQDWIAFNPFAPPISGNLSAHMKVDWDGHTNVDGNGNVSLTDFTYDRKKVSDLQLDFDVKTNLSGAIWANADVMVDGEKTMTLAGNLNDSESDSPFKLDFSLIHFPLSTVNPFLPEDIAQLKGTLNGKMIISGDSNRPLVNGELEFDKAAVRVAMTNTSYAFSDAKIPVVDNLVTLTDFNILGANDNPLSINGTVDINSLVEPKYDLKFNANNMMVVNTNKAAKNALIFGKAYIGLDAQVRGNLRFMMAKANVSILSGTNVTYILTESANSITAPTQDQMVKFVNLNDTTEVAVADSLSNENMLMMIDAQLTIESGTTITVDLPTGPRDKVMIQPNGTVTYTQTPMNNGRLTGRIDLTNGYARYTVPIISSEKVFNLSPNSYVAFNGDMLNPVLNIQATDNVKINVTQEGQNSRLVNFDIKASITGTLERMDVGFDLSTDDDLTVANELQSMSPEQRASQAMNMLLYNMYTGPGSTSDFAGNPLFSFLESQINNWAANNIKGVDLSFGINQYTHTRNGTSTDAMSYSYQVSKSLFNDRFKIVVGGNYTTDSNSDENIAENLINDISFEYFLNKQQTMVIRVFRHIGFESILEGEVTQTGVGFVYRRKLNHLSDIIPKFIRPHRN